MTTSMEVDEEVKKDEKDTTEKSTESNEKVDKEQAIIENLKEWCIQLEKGETHVLSRMIQALPKVRKQLNVNVLNKIITSQFSPIPNIRGELLAFLSEINETTEIDEKAVIQAPSSTLPVETVQKGRSPRTARRGGTNLCPPPEAELYINLLVILYLIDRNDLENAKKCGLNMLNRIDFHDKRSLDPLAAKAYFYIALIFERAQKLTWLRSFLNGALRTATLKRQSDSQAVLINCLLRTYVQSKQYSSAAKLVSKVTFPEGASNNELARFLYYQGRIKAMLLDYTAAAGYFLQAMRKAPQDSANGFKQNVQKWVVVVSLLQGEIPERSVFRVPIHRKTLAPYLELTQAIRLGDLQMFSKVLDKYASSVFENDETLTLIVRLRQNVIKTALRQISVAYSCISISDIRKKLLLQTDQEAEYLVAKAIKDNNIEAVINSDPGLVERYMRSKETEDIYRTVEPQNHYDARIRYCLELHNQAVKALRYPAKTTKGAVESIEEQREREDQELQLAKEMAEDDDDF